MMGRTFAFVFLSLLFTSLGSWNEVFASDFTSESCELLLNPDVAGFVTGEPQRLVRTQNGYKALRTVAPGDQIYMHDKEGRTFDAKVLAVRPGWKNRLKASYQTQSFRAFPLSPVELETKPGSLGARIKGFAYRNSGREIVASTALAVITFPFTSDSPVDIAGFTANGVMAGNLVFLGVVMATHARRYLNSSHQIWISQPFPTPIPKPPGRRHGFF